MVVEWLVRLTFYRTHGNPCKTFGEGGSNAPAKPESLHANTGSMYRLLLRHLAH